MREILFRGKRIDNGEWIEGAFLNDRDGSFYICPAVSDITYGDNGNRRRIGCWYKVDPETVGQFTGLTDKNGKKIFEGDIVKRPDSIRSFQVMWNMDFPAFWLFRQSCYMSLLTDCVEVIGNIHDNPELVEDSNEYANN